MTPHEMLAKIRSLPPISPAALKLIGLLARPEPSNDHEQIVRVLNQDSVLTARLLRACNSPSLGLAEPVASLDQAVLFLGYRQIFQMAITLALRPALAIPLQGYALEANDLCRHSLLAATAAEWVADDGTDFGVDSSIAFTVGLVHDLGKVIVNEFITRERFIAMREQVLQGYSRIEAERGVMGTDHAEVGAGLLALWRLPQTLVEAVALHHKPVLEPEPWLSALGCLADAAAHRAVGIQMHSSDSQRESEAGILERFGFEGERLNLLLTRILEPSVTSALVSG